MVSAELLAWGFSSSSWVGRIARARAQKSVLHSFYRSECFTKFKVEGKEFWHHLTLKKKAGSTDNVLYESFIVRMLFCLLISCLYGLLRRLAKSFGLKPLHVRDLAPQGHVCVYIKCSALLTTALSKGLHVWMHITGQTHTADSARHNKWRCSK